MSTHSAGGPLILVVDDDPRVREAIRWALEDEGFAVQTAGDGREALVEAAQHPPALVVLDLTLPVLRGDEVARTLRTEHGPSLPILVITADGEAHTKAEQAGAYAYLRKPFEVVELLAAVRRGLPASGTGKGG